MIKDALELIPILSGYPYWIRAIMLGLPPLYLFTLVMLKLFEPQPPPPQVRIDDVQRQTSKVKDAVVLNVIVANPTSANANVTAANIELFSGQRPEGGLASALRSSAKYVVAKDAGKLAVYSDQSAFPTEAQMSWPYARSTYTRLAIPLQQQIAAGGSDAFIIAFSEPALILPEHDTLSISLHYNGASDSSPREIKLK